MWPNTTQIAVKAGGCARINAENRRGSVRLTSRGVRRCLLVTGVSRASPFELTKGLERSKVAFNDNLSRRGRLRVSQVDQLRNVGQSALRGGSGWGGANGPESLTSSLQSHSHSPLCFGAWCHPTLPCTSNEPRRLCLPLPNYKLGARLRARCHPLKLLNYGHWHQV